MLYIALATAAGLVAIDQVIKMIVNKFLMQYETISLINIGGRDWLNLTYVRNTGAGFGIFKDQRWLLISVTVIYLGILLYLLLSKKIKNPFLMWAISLVTAGGFGNLIDRIFYGYVIDFIDLRIINFAVFNFADCCVVIGVIMIFIYALFISDKNKKQSAQVDDGE